MVSVIIPTYNRASYLGEAIGSVLDQDYFRRHGPENSFELLVIDDGSEDRSREVVASFGGRAVYHYQPHRGVSSARNLGLRHSRGETIAYLDSDDLWKREKIGVQMSFFKAFPDAKVCATEEIWLRGGILLNPRKKHQKYSGWIFDKVLPLCLLSLSSCLFRRAVFEEIGDFDETLPVCEDYDFGIRIAERYPIHLIAAPLIIKRGGHSDQLSCQYWGMDRFRIQALEKALGRSLSPVKEKLVKAEIVRKCRVLVQGFAKRGNAAEVEKYTGKIKKYASA